MDKSEQTVRDTIREMVTGVAFISEKFGYSKEGLVHSSMDAPIPLRGMGGYLSLRLIDAVCVFPTVCQ